MKIQHLERRLEQANSTYSEFYSEASEQSGRIEAIREERDQAWEEVRMLKNQIGYKDVEIEDLHEEIQATKAASESVEYRAETLEQRLRETREQLDNLRGKRFTLHLSYAPFVRMSLCTLSDLPQLLIRKLSMRTTVYHTRMKSYYRKSRNTHLLGKTIKIR